MKPNLKFLFILLVVPVLSSCEGYSVGGSLAYAGVSAGLQVYRPAGGKEPIVSPIQKGITVSPPK